MANAPTAEQVQVFIETYAPRLYLHSEEPYLPTSPDWFLTKSGPPVGSGADAYYEKLPEADRGGDFSQARSYVHVKKPVGGTVEIQFWIFYAYNGPGTAEPPVIDKKVGLAPFGEHGGDWEHFTYRVDLATMKPTKIYLSQHDGGALHDYSELEQENGRPVLYASLNGHATYATVGQHITHHILVNATDKGQHFETSTHDLLDGSTKTWFDFAGRWGPTINWTDDQVKEKCKAILDRASLPDWDFVVDALALAVESAGENKENGPRGPKQHTDDWSQPETD